MIAEWAHLPAETQRELIQNRWGLIAGPDVLPILGRIVEQPPPPASTDLAMTRDAALKHIQEIDPAEGRALVLRDVLNPSAHPSLDLIKLLPKGDIAVAPRACAGADQAQSGPRSGF